MSFIMRNRRVNVYKNTNLNQVVTDYRAGTPLKNVNTQEAYKNITPNVIPGGHPSGDVGVPLAGTRISRMRAAPIGGYRKTLATNADGSCCAKDKSNKNGFTQEIYRDTWTDCSGVCSGDTEGIVARPSRTKKPLIRSGMQYNAAAAPNNLRNTDETKKKYAFSYSQYQKNLRCLSYERSQEKYKTPEMVGYPEKYRKSGCNSCCNCCSKTYRFKPAPTNPPSGPYDFTTASEWTATSGTSTWQFLSQQTPFITVIRTSGPEPCEPLTNGTELTFVAKSFAPPQPADIIITVGSLQLLTALEGQCKTTRGENITVYKPNNKKFQVQGAVSSGSRLERLKIETIQGSRIRTCRAPGNAGLPPGAIDKCSATSKNYMVGYRSAKPRFVTNPNEGGAKTRGFVPTRWRQAYLAHGRSIGNIFQRTSSYNMSGKGAGALPYSIGSIKAGGCCHPPNAGTTN